MSRAANDWAWTVPGLRPPERLVLLSLADHHNARSGLCNPSLLRIAEMTGFHSGHVSKILQGDAAHPGLIHKAGIDVHRTGRGNVYILPIPRKMRDQNAHPDAKVQVAIAQDARLTRKRSFLNLTPTATPTGQAASALEENPDGSVSIKSNGSHPSGWDKQKPPYVRR